MKILFIVPSYKPAYIYGGTIVVVALLAEQLAALGHHVDVYTTTANGKHELDVQPSKTVTVDGVSVTYFKRVTGDHTHASPDLWKHLNNTVKQYDVVHIHSWWNLLVIGAALICRMKGVKPVLSPHGMLSTYILQTNNSLPKKLIHSFIGKSLLKRSWLHVSTKLEFEESRAVILGWEGEVIPNLVKLSDQQHIRNHNEVFTIGFLSRVDPKKGLDILIKALGGVNFNYKLKVAGTGDSTYIDELKALSREYGNSDQIEWIGWTGGEQKFKFLAGLDLFALTSHSENFAVVVIEALSVGTPVLISDQVGLYQYVSEHDYGWICKTDIPSVTAYLNEAFNAKEKLMRINTSVPAEIKTAYNSQKLASDYVDFYKSVALS